MVMCVRRGAHSQRTLEATGIVLLSMSDASAIVGEVVDLEVNTPAREDFVANVKMWQQKYCFKPPISCHAGTSHPHHCHDAQDDL